MGCGDIICQRIKSKGKLDGLSAGLADWEGLDWERTKRFVIVGVTLHGPFFLFGYGALDRRFGNAGDLRTVVSKIALGQVTLFPVYLCSFFVYMGLLEQRSLDESWAKARAAFGGAFITGSVFWPLANAINFKYVAPTQRVLAANAAGLVWNSFLSWANAQEAAQHPPAACDLQPSNRS